MQENQTEGNSLPMSTDKNNLIAEPLWLSYIIPLYNCEEYIATCLDSVLAQGLKYDEYEVIVVNDGSTDSGGEIVKKYCREHDNFRLINKKNGGVSSARNRGIDEAKGEYIYFMDADDYLLPDGMRTLRDEYLKEYGCADIVSFNIHTVNKHYNPHEWEHIRPHKAYFQGTFLEYGNKYGISWSVYSLVISHRLIKDYNVRFLPYVMSEDTFFMINIFSVATCANIIATDLNIYRYCRRDNSAMSCEAKEHTKRVFYDLLDVSNSLKEIQNNSPYNKDIFRQRIVFCQAQAFIRICHSSFSYGEIRKMLFDACQKKFLPIEKPASQMHKFINKTYRHSYVVYLFSLALRYVYIPLIKPLNIHNLYVKYMTSQK